MMDDQPGVPAPVRRFPVAIVVGSTGAIGASIVARLLDTGMSEHVYALSRHAPAAADSRVTALTLDYDAPDSLPAAAHRIRTDASPVNLVVVATGALHGDGIRPEKSLRQIDAAMMARVLHVNAIGPMLAAQAFIPLLARRQGSVFAALSARVGSITDNRLGGWYAYRASKAALNMLLRTAAIELARTDPEAACVGLHPGTVDSSLSAPFQGGVSEQGLFTPAVSAAHLCAVLAGIGPADTGKVFAWDGAEVPA